MGGWLRMKITDLAIVFVLITLPFNLFLDIKTQNVEIASYKKIEINRILDTAVEDGVTNMILGGAGKKVQISKEDAVEGFLNSMYVNFNALEESTAAMKLQGYISCMVVMDYDGYYVISNQEYYNSDGDKEMKLVSKPKQSFSYTYGDNVYIFTLDTNLTILNLTTNEIMTGTRDQLVEKMGASLSPDFLKDEILFDQLRRETIIDNLKTDINYAINKHNDVATQFGISYHFSLPTIPDQDWLKTVDDVGMLVFFQGMPIGVAGERINSYALGGARIVKAAKYVIEDIEISPGIVRKYYHKHDCEKIIDDSKVLDSKAECAGNGYMPCPHCNP